MSDLGLAKYQFSLNAFQHVPSIPARPLHFFKHLDEGS